MHCGRIRDEDRIIWRSIGFFWVLVVALFNITPTYLEGLDSVVYWPYYSFNAALQASVSEP